MIPTISCARDDCRRLVPYSALRVLRADDGTEFCFCGRCWQTYPLEQLKQHCLAHPERGIKP
jgi:hypothetical protein